MQATSILQGEVFNVAEYLQLRMRTATEMLGALKSVRAFVSMGQEYLWSTFSLQ